jgi:hypothetical protein
MLLLCAGVSACVPAPSLPSASPGASALTFSGALQGVAPVHAELGGCGVFRLAGGRTLAPDPGGPPLPEAALQVAAGAVLGGIRLRLMIQIDPYLGPRRYSFTAPLDRRRLPPRGTRLAFATVQRVNAGSAPGAGPGWGSRPGGGAIVIWPDGREGEIEGELVPSPEALAGELTPAPSVPTGALVPAPGGPAGEPAGDPPAAGALRLRGRFSCTAAAQEGNP